MPGKTTVACSHEQYETLISTIFEGIGNAILPNPRIATALVVEANTGLRISDILRLRLNDIIFDGGRYRFNIVEKKTGKKRIFTVPDSVYEYLKKYCDKFEIGYDEIMFPVTERCVQKHLARICSYLGKGYEHIGTHSFRKMFATKCYIASGNDIELVCRLLQHSSVSTTRRYIGISDEKVESILNSCVDIITADGGEYEEKA